MFVERTRAHGPESQIAAVEMTTIDLPVSPALVVRGARGVHDRSRFVLVRVRTRGGAVGYGEVSATPLWSGEDDVTATHYIRDVLAPLVVGEPIGAVATLRDRFDRAVAGNAFTKAGLTTALWDCLARTLDVPLTQLFGGPLRRSVAIKTSLSGDGEALEACLRAAQAIGFASFKVKVGLGVAADVRRVADLRRLVGEETFIGTDANGGWTRAEAAAAYPALHALGVAFVEQPLAAHDLEGMGRFAGGAPPTVADESIYTEHDVARCAAGGFADAVSLYVGKSGGIDRLVRSATVADACGLDVVIGSNGDAGIGAAAQIHAACACPSLSSVIPSDIIGQTYYDEDVLRTGVRIDGLHATLPDGPGLGVELEPEIERRFA